MKIDNHIGQRVKLHDEYLKETYLGYEYLKETYLGYAFPTIGREHSFLFVADEPNETFHDGANVVDEYPKGFDYPNRCWWVSWSKLEVMPKVII